MERLHAELALEVPELVLEIGGEHETILLGVTMEMVEVAFGDAEHEVLLWLSPSSDESLSL